MPLSIEQATKVVKQEIPDGKIQAVIRHNGLYLFQIFRDDLLFEEELDPFYSVNVETGELKDFSIITDGNASEIIKLFKIAKNKNR